LDNLVVALGKHLNNVSRPLILLVTVRNPLHLQVNSHTVLQLISWEQGRRISLKCPFPAERGSRPSPVQSGPVQSPAGPAANGEYLHGQPMKESASEVYLGDIIHKSGKIRPNIESRIAKGFGRVNNILAIVKETPLGWAKVKAGLMLREALLVNGMMFNSEAWHGVTKKDTIDLERVDETLLRGLTSAHSKIPIAALYLECGATPLRFVWAARRIMYLQTILKRNNDELTKKIYIAQKEDPSEGDFYELVTKDMEMIDLTMNEEEIKEASKVALRNIVKKKVKEAAFKHLMKQRGSKMKDITYDKLQTQTYMNSPDFTQDQISLLLSLRTRTVRGIRMDFGNMSAQKGCALPGCTAPADTLAHVLRCEILQEEVSNTIKEQTMQYKDVFSQDVATLKAITTRYAVLLQARERILEGASAAINADSLH
jgi:hypothetical protein